MTNRPTDRGYWPLAVATLALLLLAVLLAAGVWYLWRPQHVVWARNAYGMAAVGAWEGWDGLLASLVYWFFELKGRTVITVLAAVGWSSCAWVFLAKPLIDVEVRK